MVLIVMGKLKCEECGTETDVLCDVNTLDDLECPECSTKYSNAFKRNGEEKRVETGALVINKVKCNECGAEFNVVGEVSEENLDCPECHWKYLNRWYVCPNPECDESFYDHPDYRGQVAPWCYECEKEMIPWLPIWLSKDHDLIIKKM